MRFVPGPKPKEKCYFRRLGVTKRCYAWQLRRAMRLAQSLNPDDQRRMNEAYQTLSSPVRREIYLHIQSGLRAAELVPRERSLRARIVHALVEAREKARKMARVAARRLAHAYRRA